GEESVGEATGGGPRMEASRARGGESGRRRSRPAVAAAMIATAGAAAILVMPALQDGWSRPGRAAAGLAGGGAGTGGGWTIHAAFPPRTPADVLPGRSLVAHVAGAPGRLFHPRSPRGPD